MVGTLGSLLLITFQVVVEEGNDLVTIRRRLAGSKHGERFTLQATLWLFVVLDNPSPFGRLPGARPFLFGAAF
jgi:hypothetical protein